MEPEKHKSAAMGSSYTEKSKHDTGIAKSRHKNMALHWMPSLNSLS